MAYSCVRTAVWGNSPLMDHATGVAATAASTEPDTDRPHPAHAVPSSQPLGAALPITPVAASGGTAATETRLPRTSAASGSVCTLLSTAGATKGLPLSDMAQPPLSELSERCGEEAREDVLGVAATAASSSASFARNAAAARSDWFAVLRRAAAAASSSRSRFASSARSSRTSGDSTMPQLALSLEPAGCGADSEPLVGINVETAPLQEALDVAAAMPFPLQPPKSTLKCSSSWRSCPHLACSRSNASSTTSSWSRNRALSLATAT
mmetsp:Transcript_41824/g.115250  ORF Transcript_41824/g.115250 Transcript_41824/m.115250 type:complete len:266 (-) Transcript_41824:1319-2116(-)